MSASILKCLLALQDRGVKVDQSGFNKYELKWLVVVDDDSLVGAQVLELAQGVTGPDFDPVPEFGDSYSVNSYEDLTGVGAIDFDCHLIDNEDGSLWEIVVGFGPPTGPQGQPFDPLSWETEYWWEWEEVEIPVEEASCLDDLPTIMRGPTYETEYSFDNGFDIMRTPRGPIVNAAGQQTIDPLTTVLYRPVLCSLKNYQYAINSMITHRAFFNCINCESDPAITFLGDPHHTWKFLFSLADKRQFKKVGASQIGYYPTLTKLVYDPRTWIRKVLNNGQTCFRNTEYYVSDPGIHGPTLLLDPRTNEPLLVPASVHQLKDTFVIGTPDNPVQEGNAQPEMDDLEEVAASEPVNLNFDGTQILDPSIPANHIRYLDYGEADFNDLDPFAELIAQYEYVYG